MIPTTPGHAPRGWHAPSKQTGIKPIQTIARHTVEFSKDTRTPTTTARRRSGAVFPAGCLGCAGATIPTYMVLVAESSSARPIRAADTLRCRILCGKPPLRAATSGRKFSVPVRRAARLATWRKLHAASRAVSRGVSF
jgi:hypothetical protein